VVHLAHIAALGPNVGMPARAIRDNRPGPRVSRRMPTQEEAVISMCSWVRVLTLGWVVWSGVAFVEATQFVTEDAAVKRILELADQRLAVMPAVAAVKWQTHAPIFDPPRENASTRSQQAEPMS
jgi:hypothetical protein